MPRLQSGMLLLLLTVFLACPFVSLRAHEQPARQNEKVFDPDQVEIIVVGSPHLKDMQPEDKPDIDLIRHQLATFKPDHVVVEWLHPSIDPATTGNYRPFEDLKSLSERWGHKLDNVGDKLARARDALNKLKNRETPGADIRIELGKLYYLNRDRLNAGYQWWIAEQLGADVANLISLTDGNFENHELEVWGFPIAYAQGIEYITPFDYQAEDAAWIWDSIIEAVALHAVTVKHGLQEGEEGWGKALESYISGLAARVNKGRWDPQWLAEYGDIKEVAEFIKVIDIWMPRRGLPHPEYGSQGLSEMRYNQSAEHTADTRYMYDEVFPMISLDGLGQRLVDNWLLRNRRMADFVVQDIEWLGSTRVMIIVGEGHKPFLDAEFRARGYKVKSSAQYIP